jgi:hypothetical protein
VATTAGDEAKWFAAAKEAGLFDEALDLAGRSPCDPKMLARAARHFADKQPVFALGAGLLSLQWAGCRLRLRRHEHRRLGRVHAHDEGSR